jgi:excisionase family DNA binding protein
MTLPRHSPTITEAARLIGVNRLTIQRWVDSGRLQTAGQEPFPCRTGWRWRLDPESVEREQKLRDNGHSM